MLSSFDILGDNIIEWYIKEKLEMGNMGPGK